MTPPQAEFDQTIEDIRAFYVYALARAPAARRQKRVTQWGSAILIVGLGLLACYLVGYGFPPPALGFVYIGLAALGAVYLTPGMIYKQQMKQVLGLYEREDYRQLLGPTKVELCAEGIGITSPIGTANIEWSGISEIAATADYVFLQRDSLSALVIPRRAFADAAAFDRFVEAARLYHRNAGNSHE